MTKDELIARVRERGEYSSTAEAGQACDAVLGILGSRLMPVQAEHLAAQLPGDLGQALLGGRPAQAFGRTEFLRRVAEELGATTDTAQWDASAVLCTVGEDIGGGQLNRLVSQLPAGYASLFGHAELS